MASKHTDYITVQVLRPAASAEPEPPEPGGVGDRGKDFRKRTKQKNSEALMALLFLQV